MPTFLLRERFSPAGHTAGLFLSVEGSSKPSNDRAPLRDLACELLTKSRGCRAIRRGELGAEIDEPIHDVRVPERRVEREHDPVDLASGRAVWRPEPVPAREIESLQPRLGERGNAGQ